jgi:hypothetical protein
MYKEAQAAAPLPPQLDAFVLSVTVPHMIIRVKFLFFNENFRLVIVDINI